MLNKSEEQGFVVVALNIVIVILCVLIMVMGTRTVWEFVELISPDSIEESAYVWYLENENFNAIWRAYYTDTVRTEDKQEYYALAQYYEAQIFYTAFNHVGDTERAEKYAERMEQAVKKMGGFVGVKDRIDALVSEKSY